MGNPTQKDAILKIDFKSGRLFPWTFQLFAVALLVAAVVYFTTYTMISIGLLLFSLLIITAHTGVEFDRKKQTYREYNSFLLIKTGKVLPYRGVEKVFINSGRVSQRVYTAHTTTSSVFTNTEYRGYVKLLNGNKIFLISGKDKVKVAEKLAGLADWLQTGFTDHT